MSLGPRISQRIKKRLDDLRDEMERVIMQQVGYFQYGVYTNLGTGDYNTVKFGTRNSSPFRLPQFQGYQKGSYGIQPQYWTSMGGQARANRLREQILSDMKDEVRLYFKTIKK